MLINKQKVSLLAVAIGTAALMLPGIASAHNDGRDKNDDHGGIVRMNTANDFGVHVFDNKDITRGDDTRTLPGLFYKGMVTAVSSTGFTIGLNNTALTVTTASAKIIRIPNTVITLSNIAVNDQVFVTGVKTGTTIDASVVYDLAANLAPASAKGTVTAITGTTLTVQTKNNKTVTVNTDANTQVVQNGQPATVADVQVGSKVKLFGLWDKILNIFNAIKIHIK